MDDRILHTRCLESGDDLVEELIVHPHGIGLSVRLIQMGLIVNVPVAPLFGKKEPSRLVERNSRHYCCCFMSGSHLKRAVGPTEGIRFIKGEETHLPRSRVDNSHPYVVWVLGYLLLNMSYLSRITRCVVRPHPDLPIVAAHS